MGPNIRKKIKKFSLITGMTLLSALGVTSYYSRTLPDRFNISSGETLNIETILPISAKPAESEYTTALTNISAQASGTGEKTLMLFGTIPIKNVSALSCERPVLVPCGNPFGIKLLTDGVMVVDLTQINGTCPARECGIMEGDIIISINGENIRSNSEVCEMIRRSKGRECSVELRRGDESLTAELLPVYSGGTYKAGMWVRDSSAGIGTLTFYDPKTGRFGGLGHPVCDSDTKEVLPISEGAVGEIEITGFVPSAKGSPGQLLGEFSNDVLLGEITENSAHGLFGTLDNNPSKLPPTELAYRQEIKKGEAEMYCSIDGGDPIPYSIEIEQINLNGSDHDMIIKVTDPRLLNETGGIVQGMSGSPILQNGRFIGAVTHVFINDPTHGYAIFLDAMYF